MPKYTRQIVVFVDILGFSSMLPSFEKEALESGGTGEEGYRESATLNKLLAIFQNAVGLVKEANCKPYLFSDNLCITINYIIDDTANPDAFVDILKLLSLLMYDFAKEGYFLRGGIDAGWFLDADDIAVGSPLVTAYKLESETAIYPRIMLSAEFLRILEEYAALHKLTEDAASLSSRYIRREAELGYINPFFHIISFEDEEGKLKYLNGYSDILKEKLQQFEGSDYILHKYRWLAERFNEFIDLYTTDQAWLELDSDQLEYSESDILFIKSLKITIDGI